MSSGTGRADQPGTLAHSDHGGAVTVSDRLTGYLVAPALSRAPGRGFHGGDVVRSREARWLGGSDGGRRSCVRQRGRCPRGACVAGAWPGWCRGAAGDRPVGWAQLAGAWPGRGNVAARTDLGVWCDRSRGRGACGGCGASADRVPSMMPATIWAGHALLTALGAIPLAGHGLVHRAGRGGVLRAAAAQRQPARVGRPALGDQRARCFGVGSGVGVGFPVIGEAADVTCAPWWRAIIPRPR